MFVKAFVTELISTGPAFVGTLLMEYAVAAFATGGVGVGDQTTSFARAAAMNECKCVNFSQMTFIKNNKSSHEVNILRLADDFWLPMFSCMCEVHGTIHNLVEKFTRDGPFGETI